MNGSTKTFSDVADGKWYSSYIRQAVQYGLISGYTDGTFRPEQYITRAETVTMINRMLGRNYETAAELHSMACPFPDVSQSNCIWQYHGSSYHAQALIERIRNGRTPEQVEVNL